MSKDNGPVRGLRGDQGKGTTTIPPNDGDLRQHNNEMGDYTKSNYDVQGDTKGFGSGTSFPAEDAPVWLDGCSIDQDATNSGESITGHSKSDPMFERYPSASSDPDKSSGTNSADKVSSGAMGSGSDSTKSDPMFEKYPNATSDDDDVGSK